MSTVSREPFPWGDVMSFGLGTLGLPPSAFWAMTPRELQAAMRGVLGPGSRQHAPSQAELAALLERFPDS